MKSNSKIKLKHILYIAIILTFIYVPIASLILFSFNKSEGRVASLVNWQGFSWQWYQKLLSDKTIKTSIAITLKIAFLTTIISTFLGTFAAISLAQSLNKKWRVMILNASNFSIVVPEIITALSLFVVFGFIRLESSFWKMLLAHISFCTPFVAISVYPKVISLDPYCFEAAYDLGATPFKALIKVILPQLKGGMLVGATLAFTLSFDDFIISYFVGGAECQNISAYIYSLKGTINPSVNALSTILISLTSFKIIFDFIKQKKMVHKQK
ncbi:ABC-type spermidine/putrescine transport system, permease component II [Candidatus Phytoplasma australiense]|uniref:ABC-type spermidine/putrescine transport system, permease component II n=2 Tax=Phytoplasma australiense TaxID=59748 RepID=B1V936_PHYAS|nr:ABC transporter permease [Candidatus Phytoplasma australiense]AGL90782.1 Spermidine/putrescine transport system permease protein potC [Strawberry lethal yellows phytoplasma (CPA) str. NZSb11]CAM11468.1 ABC-type spermidine/putrescine transport system, permease component II [Candidatus Phytoplasma australiense]